MRKIILSIQFILCGFIGNTLYAIDPPDTSLGHVIKQTREMYQRGIDRKVIADYINGQVDRRIKSTNNIELFEDPLNWFRLYRNRKLNTDLESESYNDIANVAWTTGLGNCEENSSLVYYILKKAGVKEHVRIIRSVRHSFTVWDMHPSSKIGEPSTWGENAIVVDPWLGQNISKEEVETNRWFMNNNPEAKLTDHTIYTDSEADTWGSINSSYNRENNIEPEPTDNNDDTDCFIATAVYGDPNAPNISILRTYRDSVLKKKVFGRIFISTYETIGPVFAYFIRENEKRKMWTKKHIVDPAVHYSSEKLNKAL